MVALTLIVLFILGLLAFAMMVSVLSSTEANRQHQRRRDLEQAAARRRETIKRLGAAFEDVRSGSEEESLLLETLDEMDLSEKELRATCNSIVDFARRQQVEALLLCRIVNAVQREAKAVVMHC